MLKLFYFRYIILESIYICVVDFLFKIYFTIKYNMHFILDLKNLILVLPQTNAIGWASVTTLNS